MSNRRSEDNDVTVFPSGPAASEPVAPGESALLPGTDVAEFRIIRLIGEGGFGIVYLAHDESLDRTVALKEYLPSQLAERHGGTLSVQVRSQRHAEPFAAGLRSFMNEARLLARFDHPSLLKVHRFFQANGTAYMAMPYYEGQTLKAALRQLPGPPDEAWLKRLLHQLLDALEIIHSYECYHRDISPDNILMLQNDTPILLDFGAARRVIGDMTRTLTVILKPGYAPIEQYAEDSDMRQGPWTDLYALASVVYFALTREPPVASIARAMNDRLVPLSQRMRGSYSEEFLGTIDAALSLRPERRPQSVAELRAMLGGGEAFAAPRSQGYGLAPPIVSIVEAAAPADAISAGRNVRTAPPPATGPRSFSREVDTHTDDATVAPSAAPVKRAVGTSTKRVTIAGVVLAVPAVIGAILWASHRASDSPATKPEPSSEQKIASPAATPGPPQLAAVVPQIEQPKLAAPERALARPQPAPVTAAPKELPATKLVERTPAPAKPLDREQPKAATIPRVETAKALPPAKAAAPLTPAERTMAARVDTAPAPASARVQATRSPVDSRPAPQPLQRAEDIPDPAPKAPTQQVARADPEPKPGAAPPAAKSEPRADKGAVEVARIEPKAVPPIAQKAALIGRYIGRLQAIGGFPIGVTLVISSVEDGIVTGTASHTGGSCAGEYRMRGTLRDDVVRLGSTHKGGRAGDCTFGFRVAVQGNKLVGETGGGVPIELSR